MAVEYPQIDFDSLLKDEPKLDTGLETRPQIDFNALLVEPELASSRAVTSSYVDPNSEAEKVVLARKLQETFNEDWSPMAVDPAEARRRLGIAENERILSENPILSRKFTDSTFANITHKDLNNLGSLERTVTGTLGDIGVTAVKGIIGLPQFAVGLANIPTFGYAGKGLEAIGIDMAEAQNILDTMYSPAQQAANRRVQQAEGFIDTLTAAAQNPSTILTTVGESLPSMFAGGAIGRALLGAGSKVLGAGMAGPTLPGYLARVLGERGAGIVAGAAGEGLVTAGTMAEQIRAESEEGLLTGKQALASLGAGFGTGVIGAVGGKAAQKLKLTDIDTLIAEGGEKAAQASVAKTGFMRNVIGSGIAEGVFEELPQSAQEQMWQNWAQDRPVLEGVGSAAAMGFLAGAATGSGAATVKSTADRLQQARQAETMAQRIEQITQLARASQVLAADPQTFRDFMQDVGEASDIRELFVDARVLAQRISESGVPVQQLEAAMPGITQQITTAAALNESVAIPLADFATHIAPTPLADALVPDLRTEGGMSVTEARAVIDNAAEEFRGAIETLQTTAQQDATFRKSFRAVRDNLEAQVLAASPIYSKQDARAAATLEAARYAALARQLNITPEEALQRFPAIIAREGQASGGQVLSQEQKLQTDTPEFRAWFGESKAVNSEGQPVVLYRGMAGEGLPAEGVTEMRPSPGLLGTGVYMTANPRRAEGYTRGEAGQTYPLYASLQNPITEMEFIARFGKVKRTAEENQAITDQLISEGYDGVISVNRNGQIWEAVAFRPEQVKSAVGNVGTFSPTDANILRQLENVLSGKEKVPTFDRLEQVVAWIADRAKNDRVVDPETDLTSSRGRADAVDQIVKHTLRELKAWSKLKGDYRSFYGEDIEDYTNPLITQYVQERYGRKPTKDEIALIHLASAFGSGQSTPTVDTQHGLTVFDEWMRTGAVTGYSDKPKPIYKAFKRGESPQRVYIDSVTGEDTPIAAGNKPKFDTEKKAQISKTYNVAGLARFMDIHRALGSDLHKTITWLGNKHSFSEIQRVIGDEAAKKLKPHEYLDKNGQSFGVFALGNNPKLGSYILNRWGHFGTITKDMWVARTMSRYFDEPNTGEPWGLTKAELNKRQILEEAWKIVAKKLKVEPAEIQEMMWDAEKKIYARFGQTSEGAYTSSGVELALSRLRNQQSGNGAANQARTGEPSGILRQNVQPTFYSQLERSIAQAKQTSAPASDWLAIIEKLPGVKKDEIEWSGIREYLQLRGKDKVTRDELVNYMRQNGVEIEETMLSNVTPDIYTEDITDQLESIETPHGDMASRVYNLSYIRPTTSRLINFTAYETADGLVLFDEGGHYVDEFGSLDEIKDAINEDVSEQLANSYISPQYSTYVLPGGENYRELLLRLPYDPKQESYDSPHWSKVNVFAHIRFNERTDADGNRVLFIEEIQSDWAQEGRKKGFKSLDAKKQLIALNEEFENIDREIKSISARMQAVEGGSPEWQRLSEERQRLQDQQAANIDRGNALYDAQRASIPDAPFVKDTKAWVALAVKRMVRYAAENGFDKIAFVNGKQSADRYDLSKKIATLKVIKNMDGSFALRIKREASDRTFEMFKSRVVEDELSDVIGKELANRIVQDAASDKNFERDYSGLDLQVGGEGMINFYDKIVPQVVNDVLKKLGGGKLGITTINTADRYKQYQRAREESGMTDNEWANLRTSDIEKLIKPVLTEQLAFDITPEMRDTVMAGQPLFQQARGLYDPARMMAVLTSKADFSTLHHEMFHNIFNIYDKLVDDPNAPAQIREDFLTMLKNFNVPDLTTWRGMSFEEQRRIWEGTAYQHEIYLSEGKAPSEEIKGVFDRISKWIRDLYRDVIGRLNTLYRDEFGEDLPALTPEVRAVFDRMFASEQEIARAEQAQGMAPMFKTQAESGMDDATWAAYQTMWQEPTDRAVSDLQRNMIREMLRLAKMDIRKTIQREVRDELLQTPIYGAQMYLRTGRRMVDGEMEEIEGMHRLDVDVLKDMYGPGSDIDYKQLYFMYSENGLDPRDVASMFGFENADQMVRALLSAPKLAEAVEPRTNERMEREYGELNTPEAIEAKVNEAVHNELRARLITVEYRYLSKAPESVRNLMEAVRQAATDMVARKKVSELRPREHINAETKAGQRAVTALQEGNLDEQAKAKRDQMLQNRLAAETLAAKDEVNKILRKFRRLQSAGSQKNMRGEARVQLNNLLARFDLRVSRSLKDIQATKVPLGQFLQSEADRLSAFLPELPDWILDADYRQSYKELTMEQLRQLDRFVSYFENLARREQKQYQAVRNQTYKQEVESILAELLATNPNAFEADGTPKRFEKLMMPLHKELKGRFQSEFDAQFINLENILDVITGGKGKSIFESLFGRLSKAQDERSAFMKRLGDAINEATGAYSVKERLEMTLKKELVPGTPYYLTRENRIAIALFYGSETGRQRLMDGNRMTEAQIQAVLATLDEKDVNLIKTVYRLSDEIIWPELKAVNERTAGIAPEKVKALPFMTPHGMIDGGYVPLVYDGEMSARTHDLQTNESVQELLGGTQNVAATQRSASKARLEKVNRDLSLSLRAIAYKLNETVHDITHREAVADTYRLLQNTGVQNALRYIAGPAVYNMFLERVREVAVKPRTPSGFSEKTFWYLRRNTMINMMGASVNTVLLNVLGVFPAVRRVGGYRFLRAMGQLFGERTKLQNERYKWILQKSIYMRERTQGFDRDLNAELSRLNPSSILPGLDFWFAGLSVMDRMITMPTWLAAYEKGMEVHANDEKAAVDYADRVVRQTAGGGRALDLAKVAGGVGIGGELKKAITMYMNFFLAQLGMLRRGGAIAGREWSAGKKAAAAGLVTLDVMLIIVLPAALEAIARGNCGEDPEASDYLYCTARSSALFVGNFFPIFRDVLPFMWKQFDPEVQNFGVRFTPIQSAVETLGRLPKATVDILSGEGEQTDLRDMVKGIGYAVGLPGFQAWRTIDGARALMEGETENPAVILTGPPKD